MVTLLVLLVAVPAVSPEAWVAGPLAKILPSTLPPASGVPGGGARAILDGARSQHVQFQIALRPALGGSTLRSLAVVPSGLSPVGGGSRRRPAIGSAAFSPARRVVCLHVSNKDGTSAGVWPDPLPLLTSDLNATIAPNSTAALWVEVAVPRNAAPGEYAGSVAVLAAGQLVVRVPVGLKVWNFSVAQRSLRTDSKLSEQWVSRFRAREQHGANLTNIVLNYYREMVAHRVTMMGWGGVSIFPSVAATFTPDLSAVSLETAGWDAMVSELQAMGLTQLHFPLVAQCACCEPITHIRTPIPQVIPPNATWFLASGQPAISVFDADRSTLEKPVLNATFVRGLTAYTRAVVRHLDAKGWLHAAGVAPHPPPAGGVLNANYMLFIDEVDITDPFTARALLLINRLLKTLEPRLEIAQTRFPTNQYGAQNQTLVREIEGAVDLWVASIDEWSNAAASDRVPQRLAKLGSAHTMLYDNYVPSITDDGARVRLFAWALWWTHAANNSLTHGSGLGGSLSWFMDDGWTSDPWLTPNMGEGAGFWFLLYPPRANVSESGPIPSIRWEIWRQGLEESEYFFHLQRLLAAGRVPESQVAEAQAALDAVGVRGVSTVSAAL